MASNIVDNYFKRYETSANTFDPDLIKSLYMDTFMDASPRGVVAGKNDVLKAAMPERKKAFEKMGFTKAVILDVKQTELDHRYTLAKVHWSMKFRKSDGKEVESTFYISYLLFIDGATAHAVLSLAHSDEQQEMKRLGLF